MGQEKHYSDAKLIEITLDESSIGRTTPEIEHEREVAIFDLLESNVFELEQGAGGPYILKLSVVENRLVFGIGDASNVSITNFILSLSPFRRIIKDYFFVCESYFEAIKSSPPSRIEAIDMGRRGLHDEGSKVLMERLDGKIKIDMDTARRLFTLICALHWKR